ncbi:MAG: TetR/AcrR family transcriptional regulator [Saprospiraceae bacterium]
MGKRDLKEVMILNAAEKIFESVGFENTKMDDVAKEVNMSKGSIYFYFQSKENLYMAITYRGMHKLNDLMYTSINEHKNENGAQSVVGLLEIYLDFAEDFPLYIECLLNYMAINRSSSSGMDEARMTEAMKESIYYLKIQDIQNVPITLAIKEIERGKYDGSVKNKNKPELLFITAWATIVGYLKVTNASGKHRTTLLKINKSEWKNYVLKVMRLQLESES